MLDLDSNPPQRKLGHAGGGAGSTWTVGGGVCGGLGGSLNSSIRCSRSSSCLGGCVSGRGGAAFGNGGVGGVFKHEETLCCSMSAGESVDDCAGRGAVAVSGEWIAVSNALTTSALSRRKSNENVSCL